LPAAFLIRRRIELAEAPAEGEQIIVGLPRNSSTEWRCQAASISANSVRSKR
jgi:hypothetical protein